MEQLTQVRRNKVMPGYFFAGLVCARGCHEALSAHAGPFPVAKNRSYDRGKGDAQGKTENESSMSAQFLFYFPQIPYHKSQSRCTSTPHARYMHLYNLLRCCGQAAARESRNLRRQTPKIWQSPLWETPLCAFRFKRDIVDTFFHASRAACLTCTNKLPRHLHEGEHTRAEQ